LVEKEITLITQTNNLSHDYFIRQTIVYRFL